MKETNGKLKQEQEALNRKIYKLFQDLRGDIEGYKVADVRLKDDKPQKDVAGGQGKREEKGKEDMKTQELHKLRESNEKLALQLESLSHAKTKEIELLMQSVNNLKDSHSKGEESLRSEDSNMMKQLQLFDQNLNSILVKVGQNLEQIASETVSNKFKLLENYLNEKEKQRNREVEKLQEEINSIQIAVTEREKADVLNEHNDEITKQLERRVAELEVILCE